MEHVDDVETRKATGWWKLVAAVTFVCFTCAEVWAASALAIDPDNGITGHGIGVDKASAKAAALQDCENNGSDNPEFWFWNKHPGWGAVYYSDEGGGGWYAGGSLGYNKKRRAKRIAKRECRDAGGTNCVRVDLFRDTTPGKSVGKKGKRGTAYSLSSN